MISKKMGMVLELFLPLLPCSCIPVMEFHGKENITVSFHLSGVISIKRYYVKSC